ncbi:MAG: lactoylglutathione lyase [Pseudomonadota bacterium]
MQFDHIMMRVKNLDKSLDFYTNMLGMRVLRQTDYPDGKFTNTFIGYSEEGEGTTIELTHNWDQEEDYEMGEGWGHIALMVDDVYATCDKLAAAGAKIPRPAGPMKHGTRVIAFVEDPDGHKIELVGPRD